MLNDNFVTFEIGKAKHIALVAHDGKKKVEFNTAKPQYIETIWGVGYRFKV